MSSPASRKRNAPGGVPASQMQNMPQQPVMPQSFSSPTQAQLFWNGSGIDTNNMANMAGHNNNNGYNSMQAPQAQGYQTQQQLMQQVQQQYPVQQQLAQPEFQDQQLVPTPSNMLARVDPSRRGVGQGRATSSSMPSQLDVGSYTPSAAQSMQPGPSQVQDDSEIDRRAAKARADDPTRKIAPFVLKLQSFLENNTNPDLIGWSPDGKSIMIYDEENFAKGLLPNLFKHANFASFVRQLNMYGFHKHVGLGQNSMRASETKKKNVHQYWNPYFQRDKPNWLCLISKAGKTTKKPKGKKQKQAEAVEISDDEDDVEVDDDDEVDQPAGGSSSRDLVAMPKNMASVQREIRLIKQNQDAIQAQIAALKEEYSRDRNAAQLLHQRNDGSIKSILAFLANVFKNSVEGGEHSKAQFHETIANILANAGHVAQGTVVGLGDFAQHGMANSQSPPKRVQHLLPAPPSANDNATAGRSMYSSGQASPATSYHHGYQQGTVEEITSDTPSDTSSPADLRSQLRQNPQPTMMNIINNHNATTTKARNARNALTRSPAPRFRQASPANPIAVQSPDALTPPSTMSMPNLAQSIPPAIHFDDHQSHLQAIGRFQQDQVDRIGAVTEQIAPLSPTGQIPGLDDLFNDDYDMDEFINVNALDASRPEFLQDADLAGTNHHIANNDQQLLQPQDLPVSPAPTLFNSHQTYDTGMGLMQSLIQTPDRPSQLPRHTSSSQMLDEFGNQLNADGLAAVMARSSGAYNSTPSPSGTEEITRDDLDDSPGRGPKRRRVA